MYLLSIMPFIRIIILPFRVSAGSLIIIFIILPYKTITPKVVKHVLIIHMTQNVFAFEEQCESYAWLSDISTLARC